MLFCCELEFLRKDLGSSCRTMMEEVLHFPLCQNGSFYDRPIFLLFFGLSSLTKYEDFSGCKRCLGVGLEYYEP